MTTLGLFQRAVRGLTEEAAELRDDLNFTSAQYLKLLTIMKQLSRADPYVEEVLSDPSRPQSPAKVGMHVGLLQCLLVFCYVLCSAGMHAGMYAGLN